VSFFLLSEVLVSTSGCVRGHLARSYTLHTLLEGCFLEFYVASQSNWQEGRQNQNREHRNRGGRIPKTAACALSCSLDEYRTQRTQSRVVSMSHHQFVMVRSGFQHDAAKGRDEIPANIPDLYVRLNKTMNEKFLEVTLDKSADVITGACQQVLQMLDKLNMSASPESPVGEAEWTDDGCRGMIVNQQAAMVTRSGHGSRNPRVDSRRVHPAAALEQQTPFDEAMRVRMAELVESNQDEMNGLSAKVRQVNKYRWSHRSFSCLLFIDRRGPITTTPPFSFSFFLTGNCTIYVQHWTGHFTTLVAAVVPHSCRRGHVRCVSQLP
jgi:hypothetical protein